MVLPLQGDNVLNDAIGQAFFNLRLHHIQHAGALVKTAHQQRRRVAARTGLAQTRVAGTEKQPLVIALYPKMQAVGKRRGIAGYRVTAGLPAWTYPRRAARLSPPARPWARAGLQVAS